MKIYQLHLNGKNRAYHDFKSEDQALEHQNRLIRHTVDRINEGQMGYRKYLDEAHNLVIVEIEKQVKVNAYSVCEYGFRCSGIVKNFFEREIAEKYLAKLKEDSERHYVIMESMVND